MGAKQLDFAQKLQGGISDGFPAAPRSSSCLRITEVLNCIVMNDLRCFIFSREAAAIWRSCDWTSRGLNTGAIDGVHVA